MPENGDTKGGGDPAQYHAQQPEEQPASTQGTAPANPRRTAWEGIVERQLQDLQAAEDDGKHQAMILHGAGEICERRLGDSGRALGLYQQAFQKNPAYSPAIKAALRLFREAGQWEMVLSLAQALLKTEIPEVERIETWLEQARVHLFRLDDPPGALAAVRKALEIKPDHLGAIKLMEQVRLRNRETAALKEHYRDLAQQAGDSPIGVDAKLQLALLEERQRVSPEATTQLLQEVAHLDPGNPVAAAALKQALIRGSKWEDLEKLLLVELAQAIPDDRAQLHYELARLRWDRLDDQVGALETLRQGLQEAPSHPLLIQELADVARARQEWDLLLETYQTMLENAVASNQRFSLRLKMAEVCEERLDQPEEALTHLRAAADTRPDYPPIITRLAKVYHRMGMWPELVQISLDEAESVSDSEQKGQAYFRVAQIMEEKLDQPDAAKLNYQRTLEFIPGYLPAIQALARYFSSREQWDELARMTELEIGDPRG